MKCIIWLVMGWLTYGCSSGNSGLPATSETLSIAPASYLVLAQRAMTAQAEFDTAMLQELLADTVLVAGSSTHQPVALAKANALSHWQHWQQQMGIDRLRISALTNLPVNSSNRLQLTGQSGVHVISYCALGLFFRDGHVGRQLLNVCYHFNRAQRIDYILFCSPDPDYRPVSGIDDTT